MTENHSIVGLKIKGIREFKKISIAEMSERTGLSEQQIESIENDQYLPSLGPLIKIARALGVRLGTFMDDNDEPDPSSAALPRARRASASLTVPRRHART